MTDVGVQTTLVCPHSPYLRLKSFRQRSDSGLYDISYAVASDIVGLALDEDFTADPNDKHVDTMRKILAQFLKEQHGVLEKIIDDLNKVDVREHDLEPMFVAVADQVFTDGQCNWGRIVALHAFVYKLVESVRETPVAHSYGDKLSELLADYMSGRLAHWIRSVGGWVSRTVRRLL